ncbi:MAG: NAD(P)-dependent oxidoreductase [Phototrophicales bacterium]|nr:NAD(P)-dependent oxidoreductase [Phototrophicales bacterium]
MAEITPKVSYNVLITGANTPMGYEIAHRLVADGHQVTGIANGRAGATILRENGVLPILIDPTRAGEILGMMKVAHTDIVLHLSPLTRFGVPFGNMDYETDTLIASTQAVAEASKQHGVKFFLHTSSIFIYGDVTEADESTAFIRANHPLVDALRKAEASVKNAELLATILRVGHLYGANTPSLVQLADTLKLGRPVYSGGKEATLTSWTHTDDIMSAIIRTTQSQPLGEVFNIVDDVPATPADFIAYLADELGLTGRGSMTPFFERARVYKTTAPLLEKGIRVSNAKAKNMLAWSVRYANYKAGIDQTLLTLRAQSPIIKR